MDTSPARRGKDGAKDGARRDNVPTTLNKPVAALAIVPLNRSLTVTARKAYNVMLHLAQRAGDTGDAGFSAPLNAILRGFGVGNNVAGDAKRYIDQMTTTKIEWRPLSEGEQWRLAAMGVPARGTAGDLASGAPGAALPGAVSAAAPAASAAAGRTADEARDELRIFNMLAEVRLYKKAGENWVTWFYPPSIKEQMLGPHRWARLELEVIARLSTYTAVALYEICARYRDNPGGVTSRHAWAWWVPVLKGSEAGKQREWRKFKNEFVNPAMREINAVSDIEVELLEYKEGRAVADVQFGVRRKPASAWGQATEPPEPPDATQVLRALRLGLREGDVDALLERYGEPALASALDAMERTLAGQAAKPIVNKAAYLKTILAGQAATVMLGPRSGAAQSGPPPLAMPGPGRAVGGASVPGAGGLAPAGGPRALTAVGDDQRAQRQADARVAFEALTLDEQAAWTRKLREHLVAQGTASPVVVRRLDAGQWQSPLVKAMMIRFWALEVHGEDWLQARDLQPGALA